MGRKEHKKLIWKDTGQKFAAFVAPAIQNGLIELEGNESQGPLLERLTQYIRIEKVKGSGGLGQESLVTYLKQAIRED